MSYIFKIDSTTINDEPIGLRDASIEVQRGGVISGLISAFVTELTFWGDGYEYLITAASTNSPCDSSSIEIIDDCDNSLLFRGRIYYRDIEFNELKCTASCDIEDDTLSGIIANNISLKVPLSLSIGDDIDFGGSIGNIRSYKIIPALQYIFDYITNGQVQVNGASSLFTQSYQQDKYVLTCTRAVGAPVGSVLFGWTDVFEQQISGVPAFISGSDVTDADYAEKIAFALCNENIGAINIGNTVEVEFFNDADLVIEDLGGTGTITLSKTQTATYGIDNVYFTSGGLIKSYVASGGFAVPSISLGQMISLLSIYNLQMIFKKVGSSYEVDIITEAEAYLPTPSISISGIREIKTSFSYPLTFSSLNFGQQNNADSARVGLGVNPADYYYNEISYTGLDCAPGTQDLDIGYFYLTQAIYNGTDDIEDTNLYLFEEKSLELKKYTIRRVGTTAIVSYDIFFASGIHPFVAKNYVFKSPDGVNLGGKIIFNTFPIQIKKMSNFEHPLTKSDIDAILANPSNRIVFNGRNGYIESVQYNIESGNTTFQLLTE